MQAGSLDRVDRRLTAIHAVDAVGYSRLMEADERGTLGRLKMLHRELVDSRIAEHPGRILKTIGDGLLSAQHGRLRGGWFDTTATRPIGAAVGLLGVKAVAQPATPSVQLPM